jgi:hypothetical protein
MADDEDSVQNAAEQRQHDRTESVEATLAAVREDLGDRSYPVTSEELAAAYAQGPFDLPNETESLESALGRIDDSFEDEQTAFEALATMFDRPENLEYSTDARGPEPPYWEEDRVEAGHEPGETPDELDVDATERSIERSRERAREAMADEESERESDDEAAGGATDDTDDGR